MGIQSSTSGLDVKEGAEPNYAVYLFAWRGISERHVPYIYHERLKMLANTAQSILGLCTISQGSRPTGGKCERHAARRHGMVIGWTSAGLRLDVDIWGHSVHPAILGLTYPPR